MPTSDLIRSLRRTVTIAAMLFLSTSCSGCAHLATAYNGLWLRCQTKHELAGIRHDTRHELAQQTQETQRVAAEREVELARLSAERQRLEMQLCQANEEALQQQVRNNLKNVLESKVAFNVQHGLEVGELEVDTEALQQLLKERETPQSPVQLPGKRPCSCCDQPCNCGSGFLRRLCPHCRHKPCEAEKTCGGPETYAQLQQPLKQPLRPAEIPMKLPVRLSYGFQQPQMETARIRTQPVLPLRVPCTHGDCPCTDGVAPPTGFQYAPQPTAGLPPRDPYLDPNGAAEQPPLPPKPTPDNEARRMPMPAVPAVQTSAYAPPPAGYVWGPVNLSASPR